MEANRTDPRIIRLMFTVLNYIDAKKNSNNPFVKGFARVEQDVDLAYKDMVSAVYDCSDYYPEITEFVENMIQEAASNEQAPEEKKQLDTLD